MQEGFILLAALIGIKAARICARASQDGRTLFKHKMQVHKFI